MARGAVSIAAAALNPDDMSECIGGRARIGMRIEPSAALVPTRPRAVLPTITLSVAASAVQCSKG